MPLAVFPFSLEWALSLALQGPQIPKVWCNMGVAVLVKILHSAGYTWGDFGFMRPEKGDDLSLASAFTLGYWLWSTQLGAS